MTLRAQLQDSIITHGGDYRGDLTKNVTHLIANVPEGKKYQYAEQWHVRVVSPRWIEDCLERGMVLEESLYHPTTPIEEQGKGAWNREAKAQVLGKRPRDPDFEQQVAQFSQALQHIENNIEAQIHTYTLAYGTGPCFTPSLVDAIIDTSDEEGTISGDTEGRDTPELEETAAGIISRDMLSRQL